MTKPTSCKTVLLSDEPASSDWFGSHEKLAEALANLVLNEDGGRSIALTGTWGSGKSSTVKFLSNKLDERSRIFVFNAWSHQGDPLRRTFLEQLTDFLLREGWLKSASVWSNSKDKLAGRRSTQKSISTPLLNSYGKLLGISLLVTPLGIAMFSRLGVEKVPDWIPKLGVFLASAPLVCLVVVSIGYLISLGLRRLGVTSKYRWVDKFLMWSKNRLDVFAVLMNKSTTEMASETVESGQPTSVEFQDYFNELMSDALGGNDSRLIIVIDNLDRIDPEDALALWSTMTTFFDFQTKAKCGWLTSLWLVVPFDPAALSRLWPETLQKTTNDPNGEDKKSASIHDDLARIFVDKTFATAFHVPPAVRSDWRTYLVDQLTKALPEHAKKGEDEFHRVYRIYQVGALSEKRSPTPREIKVFVNKLGAVHRQMQDEIELPLQALYVVLANRTWDLEDLLRSATDEALLGSIPVATVGPDWRTAVAAIHFNAPVEKALQLLLGTKIEATLLSGDSQQLNEFKNISGVTQVIEEVIGRNWHEWSQSDSKSLALIARTLKNPSFSEDPSFNYSWRMLCDGAARVEVWTHCTPEVGDGIVEMLKHRSHEPFAAKIITSLAASSLATEKDPVPPPRTIDDWLVGISKVITTVRSEFPNALESFVVPGDAVTYISIMSRSLTHLESESILDVFAPTPSVEEIVVALINVSKEEKFSEETSNAVHAMLCVNVAWPWSKLVDQLTERLDASNTVNVKEVKASVLTLLALESTQSEAAEALSSLVDDGHLAHHLYQCDQAKDQKAVALCMLPLLEYASDGELSESPGNAATGIAIYTALISNPAKKTELVSEVAQLVTEFGKIETIISLAKHNKTQVLGNSLLKQLASGPEATTQLQPATIINHFDALKAAFEPAVLDELVRDSIRRASLLTELISRAFEPDLSDLYLSALTASPENPEFMAFLDQGLQGMDKDAWAKQLELESNLIRLVINLVRAKRELNLGIPLQDALLTHAKELLEVKVSIKELGADWSELVNALSPPSQETFLKRLSELLYSEHTTDPILEIYGDHLLHDAIFAENSERLILNAFPGFLSRGSIAELKWLSRVLKAKPDLLLKAKPSTKSDFVSRVKESYKQNVENVELCEQIAEVARTAKIKLPRIEKSPDETADESA